MIKSWENIKGKFLDRVNNNGDCNYRDAIENLEKISHNKSDFKITRKLIM